MDTRHRVHFFSGSPSCGKYLHHSGIRKRRCGPVNETSTQAEAAWAPGFVSSWGGSHNDWCPFGPLETKPRNRHPQIGHTRGWLLLLVGVLRTTAVLSWERIGVPTSFKFVCAHPVARVACHWSPSSSQQRRRRCRNTPSLRQGVFFFLI